MMKIRGFSGFALSMSAILACAIAAEAQTTNDHGTPSADAAPELTELSFLIGDWTVTSFTRNDAGRFEQSPGITFYRARWLYDGLSVLAEFYGANRDGFYGVHVVSHDPERGLVHSYFNARANRRIEFVGEFRDGEYHLSRPGGYGGGPHLYREVDSEISPDSFVKRIYQSDDGGVTWQEGDYYFRFERGVS